MLKPEHFSTPLRELRYPVKLDFSHERFRLRSLSLLSHLKESALQEIDLSDNELQSLAELNRFSSMKTLCARRNSLTSGVGMHLTVHRLGRLDVSDNRLSEVPPLKDVPQLQVLNVSRNRISEGWSEIAHCPNLQALDASQNQFDWEPDTGELRQAMNVLRTLKRLRVLNLGQNPAALHKGYRAWVLANARRLEVFDNEGVSDAERAGHDVERRMAEAPPRREGGRSSDDADGTSRGAARRIFGVPLHELLELDVSTLPRLVQECTRHVQERAPAASSDLTVDGDPSLVMELRNAFERSAESGAIALLECIDGSSEGDVRAACTLLRTFLLEMPQPVVPVEFFLPLLEAAAGGTRGAQLDEILAPMPHEHATLFEHLLAFLVNVSRPFAADRSAQQRLARVWAPCVLRAPAREMSKFKGKVVDAMAAAVLSLLKLRRGDAGRASSDDGSDGGELSPTAKATAGPATAQLIDIGEPSNLVPPASPGWASNATEAPELLARQQNAADELLSALEELQDDCSLMDDVATSVGSPQKLIGSPQQLTVESAPSPTRPAAAVSSPPRPPTAGLSPKAPSTLPSPAKPSSQSTFGQEPSLGESIAAQLAATLAPRSPLADAAAFARTGIMQAASEPTPPRAFEAPQPASWNLGLTPRDEDDGASTARMSTSSHKMALAATAALEAREMEASKLKQRAQRLLRERSELALDLEGLQDTLSRMERAVARAREQTQALRAEQTKHETTGASRHSAQISTLSKAVLREKQRRLSARNELGSLQRQLTKRRTQYHAVAERMASMKSARDEAAEKQARAAAPVTEAEGIEERLKQCHQAIAAVDDPEERAAETAQSEQLRRVEAELESRLAQLRHAISTRNRPRPSPSAAPSDLASERRLSQLAEQSHDVRTTLAAEQAQAHVSAPAIEASSATWAQLSRQLHEELTKHAACAPASADAIAEAAKWHAEARAFAAEVRRVEGLQLKAAKQKRDEREGWRDFMQETARARQRNAAAANASAAAGDRGGASPSLRHEVAQAQEALRAATDEADALMHSGGAARMRLDEAGSRLASLRSLMAQLQADAGL